MSLKLKYFVLSPESSDTDHAEASRDAMLAYANRIEKTDPQRAADIRAWVNRIELELSVRE